MLRIALYKRSLLILNGNYNFLEEENISGDNSNLFSLKLAILGTNTLYILLFYEPNTNFYYSQATLYICS